MSEKTVYPVAEAKPNFPALEQAILDFWKAERIFEKSLAKPKSKTTTGGDRNGEFVFYDGPPFANGLPHYGHLVTGFVKDIVPRYRTMRGQHVDRRFGWDCHGFPAELQAEKELNISGRKQILDYGLEKFNAYCKQCVLLYAREWEQYVTRQARWVDFKNDYKTMDATFMESVLWAFKQLWDKGLIYEAFRVVPYSWAVESPVSNFETRIDNSFRPRQDPAVTITFALKPLADGKVTKLLVWTTTPWTLPSNLALAVGPEIPYAVYELDGEQYVLGETVAQKYEKQLTGAVKVGTIKGSELVGRTYEPLFDYFAHTPNAFRVVGAAFVDTNEGTGTVHLAPGFGEDDLAVCRENGIGIVVPVDQSGKFTSEVPPYAGMLVFDANKPIIAELKQKKVLVKQEMYSHNYPHCWRTDQPLIYKAINSWYVKVTDIRERMVELNQQINWIPAHIKDGQFGKWLENARDWNISRNRFWGVPLPIWRSDDSKYPRMDVYGSLEELERDFGVRPADLHRPAIDQLTRPNPDDPTGKSTMRRIEEVLDCWFESGSMPFAQLHYPFENKQRFEANFPGDFIVEYVAQTRGWFYTLMVLATALFDSVPFRNCICHGVVLAEGGEKMSKRLRNYPDPMEIFHNVGADALRWYMVSSPLLTGGDLELHKDGRAVAQTQRLVIIPIWNAYYFFTLYANADGIKAKFDAGSPVVLDKYILAKTRQLIEQATVKLDVYDIPGACALVMKFIDALNNWFIRRSRERFWKSEKDADKQHAYNTLYTVLTLLCRTLAPLLPLVTEKIFKDLTGELSAHLADWPDASLLPADEALVEDMDRVREICSSALSVRKSAGVNVRVPLRKLTIAGTHLDRLKPFLHLVQDEVNVKAIELSESVESFGKLELRIDKKIGARIGPAIKDVMAAAKSGAWKKLADGSVEIAGQTLSPSEYNMSLTAAEGLAAATLSTHEGAVALDIVVTPELAREGLARDVVRCIQATRKDAGLQITDRIAVKLSAGENVQSVVREHGAFISEQTLADSVEFGDGGDGYFSASYPVDEEQITVAVRK